MVKMKRIAVVILAAYLAAGCSLKEFFGERGETVDVVGDIPHDMIVLGEQLEDPYSVENIQKAVLSLYPTKGRVDIRPTDYYVRFLPSGEEEYDLLESMGVNMVDHPLDYRIVREGDYYHDPQIPDSLITWQYAVVHPDFKFPDGIVWEKLDECYISENDVTTRASGIDWEAVERESYRLTGNAPASGTTKGGGDYPAAKPKGRITVLDPAYDSEPVGVAGVRVSMNSFVKFANTYTDEEGYYEADRTFSSEVRYRLVFKNRKGFSIGMNLLLCPASVSTLGKGSPEGVSHLVKPASDKKMFCRCVVNNAGWDYWQGCSSGTSGIRTPPSNLRIWLFQGMSESSTIMMQQGVLVDGSVVGDFLGEYAVLVKMFLPDITVGIGGRTDYSSIYSTAVHELSHASHYCQVGNEYWEKYIRYILTSFVTSGGMTYGVGTEKDHGYCEVGEMWAYYSQTKFFRERYQDDPGRTFGTSFWFRPQILLFMDDRGIDRFRIFAALTSDIVDRDLLRDKLISMYPECKSIISQAFLKYN